MKRIKGVFERNSGRLVMLSVIVTCLLALNLAAAQQRPIERFEYKTVWFRVNIGDDTDALQQKFSDTLNQQAAQGWQFDGRCAHFNALNSCVDFIVLRRPIP